MPTSGRDWALFVLRLGLGLTFIMHGYPKLFPAGPAGFAGFLTNLKFPGPQVLAWVVSLVEFAGGIAIVLGLLTRWAAALQAIEMVVTTTQVKMVGGVGFIAMQGTGWELDALLFCNALALVLAGAGGISVDALFRRGKPTT